MLSPDQLLYLRLLAKELIEDSSNEFFDEARLRIWNRMTEEQRDETNRIVQAIFGEWM